MEKRTTGCCPGRPRQVAVKSPLCRPSRQMPRRDMEKVGRRGGATALLAGARGRMSEEVIFTSLYTSLDVSLCLTTTVVKPEKRRRGNERRRIPEKHGELKRHRSSQRTVTEARLAFQRVLSGWPDAEHSAGVDHPAERMIDEERLLLQRKASRTHTRTARQRSTHRVK